MAKLFGYPINVVADEEGSSISVDGEAMRLSAGLAQRESNPSDSGSAPMDPESDLVNYLIDFFGRESYEIEREMQRIACDGDICGGFDVMEEDEEIDLGLGIGAGSVSGQMRGDSVTVDKDIDSSRVEVGTPLEDDLFCEEADMMMADEVLQWENLQNDITWESEPVQATLFGHVEEEDEEEEDEEEEEEEEEEGGGDELTLPPVNNDVLVEDFSEESIDEILMDAMQGTSLMDVDYEDLLSIFHEAGENHGDYYDVFAQSLNQDPPVMGTRPASKTVIDHLPVVEITSEELSKGNTVCAICIGDVVVEEKVTRLPCRHIYHGECILPWLGMKNTCPVCRFELPTDDLEYERNRR